MERKLENGVKLDYDISAKLNVHETARANDAKLNWSNVRVSCTGRGFRTIVASKVKWHNDILKT